jgi:hypothetical protein
LAHLEPPHADLWALMRIHVATTPLCENDMGILHCQAKEGGMETDGIDSETAGRQEHTLVSSRTPRRFFSSAGSWALTPCDAARLVRRSSTSSGVACEKFSRITLPGRRRHRSLSRAFTVIVGAYIHTDTHAHTPHPSRDTCLQRFSLLRGGPDGGHYLRQRLRIARVLISIDENEEEEAPHRHRGAGNASVGAEGASACAQACRTWGKN